MWICKCCEQENPIASSVCDVCMVSRQNYTTIPASFKLQSPIQNKTNGDNVDDDTDNDDVNSDTWQCQACNVENQNAADTCLSCKVRVIRCVCVCLCMQY